MNEHEPKQNKHYLVDWYHILGVPRDAEIEDIRTAYEKILRTYNPDLLPDEFKAAARQKIHFAQEACSILTDPHKRAGFDRLLSEWNKPISKNGHPIIDLSKLSQEYLLGDPGTRNYFQSLINQLRETSQFDPDTFEKTSAEFEKTEHPSEFLTHTWEKELARYDQYLALMEATLRDMIGIESKTPMLCSPPPDYQENAKAAIVAKSNEIPGLVGQLLLEAYTQHRLPLPDGKQKPAERSIVIHQLSEGMVQRFMSTALKIEEIAQKREEVMAERLRFVRGNYETEETKSAHLLVSITSENTQAWRAYKATKKSFAIDKRLSAKLLLDPESIVKECIQKGYSVMEVEPVEGLPFLEQFHAAVNNHFTAYHEAATDEFKSTDIILSTNQ